MGYSVYDRGGINTAPYVATLVADTTDDLELIPKDVYSAGTAVLVLEDSSVHMLNTARTEWVQLAAHNSSTTTTVVNNETVGE